MSFASFMTGEVYAALISRLFSARTLGIFDHLSAEALPSYLSGLPIGGEIGGARAIGGRFDSVAIVGSATLAVTYESACALAGLDVVRSKDDAACAGILAINAGTIGRSAAPRTT